VAAQNHFLLTQVHIMNSSSTLSTLGLAACLLASHLALTPAYADDDGDGDVWRDAATALSVPQVVQKLNAAGYPHVEKIQRKRGNYEVRTSGRDGERLKLYVNAQTGDILGRRDTRKADERSGNWAQRLMGNCNERRCRDDLVPAPGAATPTKP